MVGTGLAASYGILIKSAEVLEEVKNITTFVFDKTGTLTAGEPKVKDLIVCKEAFKVDGKFSNSFLYQVLYLTEASSEHPIAKAICSELKKKVPNM